MTHEELSLDSLGRAVVDTETAFACFAEDWRDDETAVLLMRGAGTVSGIAPGAIDRIVNDKLMPLIDRTAHERPVVILSDGDVDNREFPDIGTIVGMVRDKSEELDAPHKIRHVAVQTGDWYYPSVEGSNLANSTGRPYRTFVIERGAYPGDHTYLTQSPPILANSHARWMGIGASGVIADEQLTHFVNGVPPGQQIHATLLRAENNQALSVVLDEKLASATIQATKEAVLQKIAQRQQIFGKHWNNDGLPAVDPARFERPEDDHRVVVVWEGDEADVLNCKLVDLHSGEWDEMFRTAPRMVKTQPVRPRRVQSGPETVYVGSAGTSDIAQPGDYVFPTLDGSEEYVVHQEQLGRLWKDRGDGWFEPVPDPRAIVVAPEDIVFKAPWGEFMAVRKGDAVQERQYVDDSEILRVERYGIAAKNMIDMRPVN